MNEEKVADTAFTMAEMASDDSVTMAVLAGREGRFSRAEPLTDPPVTYLAETEAPVYVLTNGKRGIGLGTKSNTVEPEGDRRTVVLVTGRRTLCLVGQDDGDEVIEVPHEALAGVSYSRGLRKHRLALRTPRSAYHCWVHRKTDEDLLERVTTFLDEKRPDDPTPKEGEQVGRVMYRGRPVQRSEAAEPSENGTGPDEDEREQGGGEEESEEDFTVTWRGQQVERD